MSVMLNFLVHGGRVVLAHSFGHGQNLDLERPGAKSDFDLVADLHVIACLRGLAVYRNARVVARLVCNCPALDEPGNLQILVQTHDCVLLSK